MAEWGWVALGYAVAYASLLAYRVALARRLRGARHELDKLR